jgi:hypothetical protein
VIIFDPDTGQIQDFIRLKNVDASFRPVGLQFSPDGKALYIASIENHEVRKLTPTGALLNKPDEYPFAMTGVIWKVWRSPSGPVINNDVEATGPQINATGVSTNILDNNNNNNATRSIEITSQSTLSLSYLSSSSSLSKVTNFYHGGNNNK